MNDIMLRLMRNESMTLEEARIYEQVRELCRNREDFDGLYVLVTAINDVATSYGFKLKLDLSRKPQKVPRKHNGDFHDTLKGIWPSISGLPPKEPEREMGPLESWLRSMVPITINRDATIYAGAEDSLIDQGCRDPDHIDIMSEAIEAAEALGL